MNQTYFLIGRISLSENRDNISSFYFYSSPLTKLNLDFGLVPKISAKLVEFSSITQHSRESRAYYF